MSGAAAHISGYVHTKQTTSTKNGWIMALIVAYLTHVVDAQQLRAAVASRHTVIHCVDWHSVFAECDANPVQMAIIDLAAGDEASFDNARKLRAMHSRVTLIAWATAGTSGHTLFDAGRYGFEGLILSGKDDKPDALLARISQAESRGVIAEVRRMLAPQLHQAARDAILISVTRAHERLSPDSLARLLGMSRRQLARILAADSLPPSGQLLMWGRLIVAAHMLEDPQRNADGVARVLRFPSGSAFRNVCRRYLGAAPGQIRENGGSRFVVAAFGKLLAT
jgi:AraC-like DNA-binding protein